jgi:cell division transport system ATP-binding protein
MTPSRMISVSHVSKRYPGGYDALRDVTFTVEAGEMAFITGHSGAGKSTLLKLIAAIEMPTSGGVIINGQNVSAMKSGAIPYLRRNFGLIFQDHKLLFDRSVFENVALPLAITGFPRGEIARRARAALDKVGLLGREKARPITLSGGEQQRLCIARAIVNRPAILLADEPTGNLDQETGEQIIKLLFELRQQEGASLLLITHDRALAKRCDRIAEVRDGKIISGNHP